MITPGNDVYPDPYDDVVSHGHDPIVTFIFTTLGAIKYYIIFGGFPAFIIGAYVWGVIERFIKRIKG